MKFHECEEKGLIRKDDSAPARVAASLESSARFLTAARKNIQISEFEMAEIAAYNSAFHSARSLLFFLGYVERSHVCLITALNHIIHDDRDLISLLKTLDKLRLSRHNVQYGGSLVNHDEAEYAADFAGRLLTAVKTRLH